MVQRATHDWTGLCDPTKLRPGSEVSLSAWTSLSQLEVDVYGALIADMDPMHNDPNWQPGQERWGGPIILGSHMLAKIPEFLTEHGFPVRSPNIQFSIREIVRVRFTAPLRIGHRVRDHLDIVDVAGLDEPTLMVRTKHTLEREALDKPFMVAEVVSSYTSATDIEVGP